MYKGKNMSTEQKTDKNALLEGLKKQFEAQISTVETQHKHQLEQMMAQQKAHIETIKRQHEAQLKSFAKN